MAKIEEILQVVVTRAVAWEWMAREYLGGIVRCPNCRAEIAGARALAAFRNLTTVYCADCCKRFVATTGTPIHQTSWTPEGYLQCVALHSVGRRPREIAAHLRKSEHTVRDMIERIGIYHTQAAHCPAATPPSGARSTAGAAKGSGNQSWRGQ